MKKHTILIGGAFFLLIWNTPAFGGYVDREYKDMDLDDDSSLSWKEFKSYERDATPEQFSKIDTNSNGRLDFREWVAYQDRDYPYESKYSDNDRDVLPERTYPRRYHRYSHSYPRYGFRFQFGYGGKGHRHGGYRYRRHSYRYKHYYGYRHYRRHHW